MPAFSVSVAAPFTPATATDAPVFIQFQDQGTDLGGPDADVLNFGTGLLATRGVGEQENVVTVTAEGGGVAIQWQLNGADLGNDQANTVNVDGSSKLNAFRVNDTITLTLDGLNWRGVTGDATLQSSDYLNGIAVNDSNPVTVTIPADADLPLPPGLAIPIYTEGTGTVNIVAAGGVTLRIRSGLTAQIAGQYGACTIMKIRTNEWFISGDLVTA